MVRVSNRVWDSDRIRNRARDRVRDWFRVRVSDMHRVRIRIRIRSQISDPTTGRHTSLVVPKLPANSTCRYMAYTTCVRAAILIMHIYLYNLRISPY